MTFDNIFCDPQSACLLKSHSHPHGHMFVSAHINTMHISFHFHSFLNNHTEHSAKCDVSVEWLIRTHLQVMSPTWSLWWASLRITSISGSTRISATTPWIWRPTMSSQWICWLHQKWEASADQPQVYHSHREEVVTDSSRLQSSTREFVALWHSESKREMPPRFLKKTDSSFSQEAYSEIVKREWPSWESWRRHSWASTTDTVDL